MPLYAGFHKQILPLIAECGDLVVNRQAPTLHKRMAGHIPLRHNFHQTNRKSVRNGATPTAEDPIRGNKIGLQRKEKNIGCRILFSFGCIKYTVKRTEEIV